MNKPVPSRRWFGLRRADAAFDHGDWADQGTAFGMELSLSGADDDADRAPAPRQAPAADRPDWMQRLWARRKPAF